MRKRSLAIIALLSFCAAGQALTIEDTWRYTTKNPGEGWEAPGVECGNDWKTGKAGFGQVGTPGGKVNTAWTTPDIWLRGEYVLDKKTDVSKLSLEVCHDEDFEVYINGVLAASATGHFGQYQIFAISPAARQALKPGANTIAVHCHQTAGGQYIDVAFTTKKKPSPTRRGEEPVAEPELTAAEAKYVKQATWAETLLAVRAAHATTTTAVKMPIGSALARELWRDFPRETDWLMQDSSGAAADWIQGERDGKGDLTNYMQAKRDASLERGLIERALGEYALGASGAEAGKLRAALAALVKKGSGPEDRRWLELYVSACQVRRVERLRPLLEKTNRIIFAKHHNMGGGFFAYTEYTNWGGNKFGGLCRLDLDSEAAADGKFATVTELIKTDSGGVIRDPALSYDARRLLFAWRQDAKDRYYKIHEMELATGKTRLITGADTYGASYDPAYLPNGEILFTSSRIIQSVDCAGPDVSNFFICDKDGQYARRVGFDQVHTLCPVVLDDGRVVYMRWDYNDRSQIYTQALFQMNPDGTGQTEYYGNNTFEPTTFFHPRPIPGTGKVLAAIGGHHNPQCGKLAVIDPGDGRQGTDGVVELPFGKKPEYNRADRYAQTGDQYMYPYPLDESSLLVSYDPLGYRIERRGRRFDNKDHMRFHLYYMTFDGRRELLAADARISSCQPIPVIARQAPPPAPSRVDHRLRTGTFYLQDVHHGPGLTGIPRGTIKKLRVVAIKYKEMSVGANSSSGKGGGAAVVTPVAIGTGSWDAKAILGDATVYDDGSAMFTVPAKTPVYFQALNEKNQVVQTMRSWATLMPGENFSCAGCHESKNTAPPEKYGKTLAMRAGPETLAPFHGPARGFSFPKEIQPILDRSCVSCHKVGGEAKEYLLTGEPALDQGAKRYWSRAYLTFTQTSERGDDHFHNGRANELVNWINNSSEPTPIPPRYGGSTRSKLITILEEGHYKVQLTREEMDKFCAWIDLVVPFCGDNLEANAWSEGELKYARERLALHGQMKALDRQNIEALLAAEE